MKYYHSIEDDRILTTDDVRACWEIAKQDGDTFLTSTFDRFLEGSMYWNNGDLEPLGTYADSLRRRLSRIDPNDDEFETVTAQLSECMKYLEV